MTLDSWLVARLARELETALRGARVQGLQSSDDSFTLQCYRRGAAHALRVVLNQNAPLVAVAEQAEAQKEKGSGGWASSVAALLRGCTVDAIQAVPNDRVIFVDLSSRSAFGLPSITRIVLELQPRKANVLVLRPGHAETWVTVAAAKQFEAPSRSLKADATPPARDVEIGAPYVLPPARQPRLDRAQFLVQAEKAGADDVAALARLLGDYDPSCTPPLAREVVHCAGAAAHSTPAKRRGSLARRLLDEWQRIRREVEDAEERDLPLYAYERDQKLVACHLIALTSLNLEPRRSASLNELCLAALDQPKGATGEPDLAALRKRLATMLSRCRSEAAALERSREKAAEADALRVAGELIYANLAAIAPGTLQFTADATVITLDPTLTAKENAAHYFRRYKKARSGLPQIAARLRVLAANREFWEQLLWELDRAELFAPEQRRATISELKAAAGIKDRKPAAVSKAKRAEHKVELAGGATAYVGRSPKDNERLTFSVAGPNDWWFHARAIPGAHVIVKTNGSISEQQIAAAAALAAGHSRGASSAAVDVDYTQRKHVRRQAAGKPGLVWYDNFKTVRVAPRTLL
ncbi:MAG TPA: NFACT RNA binding domain-containing protein [Candidatus Eremiobacteraceae bacterium]|nr:NFACT RNA binding domain-containing protein [Candidatus Eremiobacteraceae bacterium]